MKGYVKSISDSAIVVLFGRQLEGKVEVHSCSLTDCAACSTAQCILNKYSPGSVVEVAIDSISLDKKTYNLILSDNQNQVSFYSILEKFSLSLNFNLLPSTLC